MRTITTACMFFCFLTLHGQYWQQKVNYEMDIDFQVEKHQYSGKQTLRYYNNSPDTLYRVFFHLYNNAFQPGSLMAKVDKRKTDPEKGVKNIKEYNEEELGYINVNVFKQNGVELEVDTRGTIMLVELARPLAPKKKTSFYLEFEGQVPIQTRRSGRDNREGVAYSMAQWYPKICEYDRFGWHADPYVGKEFYGVWGDFDVKITIDSDFVLGGSGEVVNPKTVKNGYAGFEGKPEGERVTWHFVANNVHDFMWAADRDYLHRVVKINDKLDFHLLYKNDSSLIENWTKLEKYLAPMVNYVNKRYGEYSYSTFSIIQGGDRGMEYPTSTLVTGKRSIASLVGVLVHEYLHSYYYLALGTNENAYAWMDEGFTSYTDRFVTQYLLENDSTSIPDFTRTMARIIALTESEKDEIMSTHANHFIDDVVYSYNAYRKGTFYLHQLAYIIGQEKLDASLLRYYDEWKSKHPGPEDFLLIAEKVSGIELDWYNDQFIRSMKKIDYGIHSILSTSKETKLKLERKGDFIMPVDVLVILKNGEEHLFSIPLKVMWGQKENQGYEHFYSMEPWPFVQKEYSLTFPFSVNEIYSISLDPELMTLDIDRENNDILFESETDTELLFKQ